MEVFSKRHKISSDNVALNVVLNVVKIIEEIWPGLPFRRSCSAIPPHLLAPHAWDYTDYFVKE